MVRRSAGAALTRGPQKQESEIAGGHVVRRRKVKTLPDWVTSDEGPNREAAEKLLAAGWESNDAGKTWELPGKMGGLSIQAAYHEMQRAEDGAAFDREAGAPDAEPVSEDAAAEAGDEPDAIDDLIDGWHQKLEAAGWTVDHGAWRSPKGRIFNNIKEAFDFQFPDGETVTITPEGAQEILESGVLDPDDETKSVGAGEREHDDATVEADQAAAQARKDAKQENKLKADIQRTVKLGREFASLFENPHWRAMYTGLEAQVEDLEAALLDDDEDSGGAMVKIKLEKRALKTVLESMRRPVVEWNAMKAAHGPLFEPLFAGYDVDFDHVEKRIQVREPEPVQAELQLEPVAEAV